MIPGFELGVPGHIALQYAGQDFLRRLDEPFGPARLLRLEGGHLDGQFGGTLHVLQVLEVPSFELCAVTEVGIFGESVVLPAASLVNHIAAPHSGRSVEVEENPGAGTASVFEHEVAVEQNRFDLCEEAVVTVEMGPPGLHHADLRLGKVVDHLHQPVTRRHEVGVKDRDEFAAGSF